MKSFIRKNQSTIGIIVVFLINAAIIYVGMRIQSASLHKQVSECYEKHSGERFQYTEVLEDMCMSAHIEYDVQAVKVEGSIVKYITIYGDAN